MSRITGIGLASTGMATEDDLVVFVAEGVEADLVVTTDPITVDETDFVTVLIVEVEELRFVGRAVECGGM